MCSVCWRVSGYPLSRDPLTKQKIMSKSPLFRLRSRGSLLTPAHSGSHNPHNIIVFSLQSPFPVQHSSIMFQAPLIYIARCPPHRQWPGPGVMVILLWTRRQPGHVLYCCKCLIITLRFGSLPTRDYNYISARIWASLSASSFLI